MMQFCASAAECVAAGMAVGSALIAVAAFFYGVWVGMVQYFRETSLRASEGAWCRMCGESENITEHYNDSIRADEHRVHYALTECGRCGELSFYVYSVTPDYSNNFDYEKPPGDGEIPF